MMQKIQWIGRWFPVLFTLVMLSGALAGRLESIFFSFPPIGLTFLSGLESVLLLFVSIFLQALPFLLIGTVAAGIIGSYLSQDRLRIYMPEGAPGQVCWGVLAGMWLPVGETGTIPLAKQFRKLGLPASFTAAFMVAAPIVNPVTLAGLWVVFGVGPVMVGCVATALLAAAAAGAAIHFRNGSTNPSVDPPGLPDPEKEPISRFQRAVLVTVDLLFDVGRWLAVGALISAGVLVVFQPGRLVIESYNGAIWVLVSGFLQILRSTEASSAPFALMPMIGLIPKGALISAIVLGSQINIKRLILLRSVIEGGGEWVDMVLLPVLVCMVMGAGLVTFFPW